MPPASPYRVLAARELPADRAALAPRAGLAPIVGIMWLASAARLGLVLALHQGVTQEAVLAVILLILLPFAARRARKESVKISLAAPRAVAAPRGAH